MILQASIRHFEMLIDQGNGNGTNSNKLGFGRVFQSTNAELLIGRNQLCTETEFVTGHFSEKTVCLGTTIIKPEGYSTHWTYDTSTKDQGIEMVVDSV